MWQCINDWRGVIGCFGSTGCDEGTGCGGSVGYGGSVGCDGSVGRDGRVGRNGIIGKEGIGFQRGICFVGAVVKHQTIKSCMEGHRSHAMSIEQYSPQPETAVNEEIHRRVPDELVEHRVFGDESKAST